MLKLLSLKGGRIGRLQFLFLNLLIYLPIFVVTVAVAAGGYFLDLSPYVVFTVIALFVLLFFYWSLLITVKRLHDIGLSGWWFIPMAIVSLVAEALYEDKTLLVTDNVVLGIFSNTIVVTAIAIAIALLLYPGQKSDNKFGPKRYKSNQTNEVGAFA